MHILRCASSRTSFKGGDATKKRQRSANDYEDKTSPRCILRCDDKTSPQPPSKGETRRKSDNALLLRAGEY